MVVQGKLGQFEYSIQIRMGLGRRVVWKNPPPAGTVLYTSWGSAPVVVLRIGLAGKVEYKDQATGSEGAAYPGDLKIAPAI